MSKEILFGTFLGIRNLILYKWSGHMIKMIAMHIYGENLQTLFRNKRLMILDLGMEHQGVRIYKVCIHNDDRLTYLGQGKLDGLYDIGKMLESRLIGIHSQQMIQLTNICLYKTQ